MSRIIKCEVCGVDSFAKRSDKKTCSRKCKNKKWKRENPEKDLLHRLKSREKNIDKKRISDRRYRELNSEKLNAYRRRWSRENPEKWNAYSRRRYLLKMGYPEELLEVKELQYQLKKEIEKRNGENQ